MLLRFWRRNTGNVGDSTQGKRPRRVCGDSLQIDHFVMKSRRQPRVAAPNLDFAQVPKSKEWRWSMRGSLEFSARSSGEWSNGFLIQDRVFALVSTALRTVADTTHFSHSTLSVCGAELHNFAAKNSHAVENDREAISHSAPQSQSFRASATNKQPDCTR